MGVRSAVKNKVAKALFSIERRNKLREKAERARISSGAPHLVEYFHEAGDPYSHLMVQMLPEFCRRYDIELNIHIVPPPPDWAAPDRGRLEAYSRQDAERLAQRAGLDFNDPGEQPDAAQIQVANAALIAAREDKEFAERAFEIGQQLWRGTLAGSDLADPSALNAGLEQAAARRDELGHYLGAMLYYAGEWYWGPDRLHYLEARLQSLGASRGEAPAQPILPPAKALQLPPAMRLDKTPELHWYLSYRSPYTAVVVDRVKALADVYGAELKLRFVLPMVMRGMKVPRKKGFYIVSDVVREAERQSIPFGNSVDPVGEPVERGYAILHEAMKRGRGLEFTRSFLTGVWADGIDAGSDRGLKKITERAGLPWSELKDFIGTEDWRPVAEANRQEMFEYNVWGVPSFRVNDVATWGQDRLWLIEEALQVASKGGD